jgi:hypothetical protein
VHDPALRGSDPRQPNLPPAFDGQNVENPHPPVGLSTNHRLSGPYGEKLRSTFDFSTNCPITTAVHTDMSHQHSQTHPPGGPRPDRGLPAPQATEAAPRPAYSG